MTTYKADNTGRHPGGQPAKYTSADQMRPLIEKYFVDSLGHQAVNQITGEPCHDKNGQPLMTGGFPLTLTGLQLALDFTSYQQLLEYEEKPEFKSLLTRARATVKEYAERRLYDKDGSNGARFYLERAFGMSADPVDTNFSISLNIVKP